MQESTLYLFDLINPLIKLVKEREQLYFQLLSFVNTHITADSNDLDALTIFGRFISHLHAKNSALRRREEKLIGSIVEAREGEFMMERESVAKEMLRFSSRVLEMLEASTARVRKSVFDEGGLPVRELGRFKSALGEMLKRGEVSAREYCEYIINFTAKKFARQANKLQKYLEKIERGEDTCLREFYSMRNHPTSDHSQEKRLPAQEIPVRRLAFKLDIKQISPEQPPDKKSLKKTIKPSTKRSSRPHHNKQKQRVSHQQEQQEEKPMKQPAANKLLKFYSLLQLNKKEFLEDYIYQEVEQQKHKRQLMEKLMQRNKQINSQISNYVRKSTNYLTVPHLQIPPPTKSSGDQRNDSLASRNSLRTSFLISKRKTSFHQDYSAESRKETEGMQPAVVVKNINPKRRSSHSNHRAADSKKRIFVVKQPMVFEDDVIPQAQVNQTQWLLHAPLSNRYNKERRNENIRLKKKPNPAPMEGPTLPDSFRYPL